MMGSISSVVSNLNFINQLCHPSLFTGTQRMLHVRVLNEYMNR